MLFPVKPYFWISRFFYTIATSYISGNFFGILTSLQDSIKIDQNHSSKKRVILTIGLLLFISGCFSLKWIRLDPTYRYGLRDFDLICCMSCAKFKISFTTDQFRSSKKEWQDKNHYSRDVYGNNGWYIY